MRAATGAVIVVGHCFIEDTGCGRTAVCWCAGDGVMESVRAGTKGKGKKRSVTRKSPHSRDVTLVRTLRWW